MSQKQDYSGRVFGRLTVICDSGLRARTSVIWDCVCVCGAGIQVPAIRLRTGKTMSCGCLRREVTSSKNVTHGLYGTPEHRSWKAMLNRCRNANSPGYYKHGGRGIQVCDRWVIFTNFLDDMGPRVEGTTLDRINNEGNYEPGNCRWATPKQQNENTRQNRFITFDGRTMTVTEWARATLIPLGTLRTRLAAGWAIERVLSRRA